MIIKNFLTAAALAATFATAAVTTAPAPAQADSTATAITAGILGLAVGALLFDNNTHRYYYVNGGHRRYVSDSQAQQWYRQRDPAFYNAHRQDFANHNGSRVQNDWQNGHRR